ncbi:hypothetical protein NQ036_03840 [Brevibacterium sp. 91QC2O2]|uniref:hypothetical protein n=1 Tax=Brevibacterium TaxID=1696 RepID=UPI00211BF4B0|nr:MULTISPECIES: hypothetical protein [unclassified Brevibacterium]MCQ9367379.1 hypothetical protein [Brevibacterium sp. 91QC2O2]MCQ9384608.1 hypothetical protein [Brevibacterium sp. 68QC2CO]
MDSYWATTPDDTLDLRIDEFGRDIAHCVASGLPVTENDPTVVLFREAIAERNSRNAGRQKAEVAKPPHVHAGHQWARKTETK